MKSLTPRPPRDVFGRAGEEQPSRKIVFLLRALMNREPMQISPQRNANSGKPAKENFYVSDT
jgi:hypothetical protein